MIYRQRPIDIDMFIIMEDFFPVGKRKGTTNMAKIVGYLQKYLEECAKRNIMFQPSFLLARPFQYKDKETHKQLDDKTEAERVKCQAHYPERVQHATDAMNMALYAYHLLLKGDISVL